MQTVTSPAARSHPIHAALLRRRQHPPGRLLRDGAAGIGLLLLSTAACASAAWPERPLRFVIPFPAGGVSDIIGRSIAARLGDSLKQTVIVDNRVGAGGTIGADVVSRATPDGYTLLLGSLSTHAIAPHVFRKLPYDPVTGFAPVGTVVVAPNLLGSSAKLDVRAVKDVIALAKAKPGGLSYASSGIGTVFHLSGELFNLLAGIDTVHVPFKGLAAAYPEVGSGQSVPGYDVTFWQALFAPPGTAAVLVARINDEVNRSLKLPEVREAFAAQGAEVFPGSPVQLATLLKNDIALMGKLVRQAKVQPD